MVVYVWRQQQSIVGQLVYVSRMVAGDREDTGRNIVNAVCAECQKCQSTVDYGRGEEDGVEKCGGRET